MDHELDAIGTSHQSIDEYDFKTKDAASRSRSNGKAPRKDGDPEVCTICLQTITERAVAVPCNHLTFDFICLASWLQERSTCPLCNATVTEVQYDFRGPDDFKRYQVPATPTLSSMTDASHEDGYRSHSRDHTSRRRRLRHQQSGSSSEDPAIERRRLVYQFQLFSLHVGANRISGYHDFTLSDFANSSELQRRARMFLRRELQVFSFLDTARAPRGGNRDFLLEYIVAILRANEVKGASGHAENLLTDYLGRENARLLLHELEAWLRSPFASLGEWDAEVQYHDERVNRGEKA
jgi:hypothetical protein